MVIALYTFCHPSRPKAHQCRFKADDTQIIYEKLSALVDRLADIWNVCPLSIVYNGTWSVTA